MAEGATAEEAIQRAKEIAARLSGKTESEEASSAALGKRKRWGLTPDEDSSPDKKQQSSATVETQKRLWIVTKTDKPPSHFVAFLTPKLEDLAAVSDDLRLELDGRGASNKPPLPGMPLEPLHVLVSGSPQAIALVEPKIQQLLTEAEQAPLLMTEPSENGGALTLTGDYKPSSVAQLLGNKNLTPAQLVAATTERAQCEEESFAIPNSVVGFIIGRGGENIASMQAKTGCRVQLQKETELLPGQTERMVKLQAPSKEAIAECRALIENMVQDKMQTSSVKSGGKNAQQIQDALAQGHKLVTIDVPDADIGLVIGRAGSTIRSIQEQSGASNIQVPQTPNEDNPQMRTVSITHPTEQGAMHAKQIIQGILDSRPSYANKQQTSIQVPIPDRDVGLCIGRGGSVVKHMQNTTNTRIQIPSQTPPGEQQRLATVTGSAEGCSKVKQMIERIIQEQSSASVMSGAPYGGPTTQQQYYTPQDGQQYSAEWAAYYAAQAAAQQQQSHATSAAQPAPAPTTSTATAADTSGQPAADSYHEQFFRYAYYYGEEAARKYYGAWSPPVGTPNPYGVNPAGIQPAPAAAAPIAETPAAAPTSAQTAPTPATSTSVNVEGKETGRRKVSNLPAWMTKS